MKCGKYICNHDDYYIEINLKETDKSYILELIRDYSYFPSGYIKLLFCTNNKALISKSQSQHAFKEWSDEDFTIYPFRAGIPFYFEHEDLVNDNRE